MRRMAAAEGHGKGNDGFLTIPEEQLIRAPERPVIGPHVAPQRQLTQVPDEAVMKVYSLLPIFLIIYTYFYSYFFPPFLQMKEIRRVANCLGRNSAVCSRHSGIGITIL